jgi:hypothetical protein
MNDNYALIQEVRKRFKHLEKIEAKLHTKLSHDLNDLEEKWELACHLSHGSDPNRTDHWEKEAARLRRKIEQFEADET